MANRKSEIANRHFGRGVTLTEVVVASALLLASIVPLLKAMTVAQVIDRTVERKSWSLMLAQAELDRIRARSIHGYDHDFSATSTDLAGGYLCSVDDDQHPSLRTVVVSVGLDQDGNHSLSSDEIEIRLCTCLARRWPGPD